MIKNGISSLVRCLLHRSNTSGIVSKAMVSRLHEHHWHTRALTDMHLVLPANFANQFDVADLPEAKTL